MIRHNLWQQLLCGNNHFEKSFTSMQIKYQRLAGEDVEQQHRQASLKAIPRMIRLFLHPRLLATVCATTLLYLLIATLSSSRPASTQSNLESRLPKQVQLSEQTIFQNSEKTYNVAGLYWQRWSRNSWDKSVRFENLTYCDEITLTPVEKIQFNNRFWQIVLAFASNQWFPVYLYNAYYDRRPDQPVVRLIADSDHQEAVEKVHFT